MRHGSVTYPCKGSALCSARRRGGCYLFKVARDGEGLVPQSEVARDGDAVLADHCDARTLYMDHAAA